MRRRTELFTMGEQTHTDDVTSSSALNNINETADEHKKLDTQDSCQIRSSFSGNIEKRYDLMSTSNKDFIQGITNIRDQLIHDAGNPPTGRLDPQTSERQKHFLNLPDLSELATLNTGQKRASVEEDLQSPQRNTGQRAINTNGSDKDSKSPVGLKLYKRKKLRNDVLVRTNRVFRQRYHLQTKYRERKIPDNILSHINEFRRPPFKSSIGKNWYVDQITKEVQKLLKREKKRSRGRPNSVRK